MSRKKVVVMEYDSCWPKAFRRICREINMVLRDHILAVEHIGSTSVPGLAAKPIIDLDVVISDNMSMDYIIEKLNLLDYEHQGDLGIPGREAFGYESKPHLYKHHLYVCRESSEELKRHILFREYLKTHPEDAEEYGAIKRKAAILYPDSIGKYMACKSDYIEKLYVKCGLQP